MKFIIEPALTHNGIKVSTKGWIGNEMQKNVIKGISFPIFSFFFSVRIKREKKTHYFFCERRSLRFCEFFNVINGINTA